MTSHERKKQTEHKTQKRNQRLLWLRQKQGYAEGTGQKFTHHEHEEHGYCGNLGLLIISLNFFFFLFLSFLGGKEAYIFDGFKNKNWMYKCEVKLKNLEVVFPLHYFIHFVKCTTTTGSLKKKSDHNLLLYSSDLLYLSQIAQHCLVWP